MAAVNSKPQKACGWTGTGRHRRQRDERVLIRQRTSWDLVWSPPRRSCSPPRPPPWASRSQASLSSVRMARRKTTPGWGPCWCYSRKQTVNTYLLKE